jgi:hypothetical protein
VLRAVLCCVLCNSVLGWATWSCAVWLTHHLTDQCTYVRCHRCCPWVSLSSQVAGA